MKPVILIWSDCLPDSGLAQCAHALSLGLLRAGFRSVVAQNRESGPGLWEREKAGVRHLFFARDVAREAAFSWTDRTGAARLIGQAEPDLIVFFDATPLSNFAAKQVAVFLGLPFLAVEGAVAQDMAERYGAYAAEVGRYLVRARAVIATSSDSLAQLGKSFGVERGRVVRPGVAESFFRMQDENLRRRLRQSLKIPDDGILVLSAARLDPVKGWDYLLAALESLSEHEGGDRLYFAWLGEGKMGRSLRRALEERGLLDRAHLLGFRQDYADWLDAADIFVLPSRLESIPLALLGAMAKGVPVVAASVGGVPEAVGDAGLLLADGRAGEIADSLVASLLRLARDEPLRCKLGQDGQARAAELFREERMVAEIIQEIGGSLFGPSEYVAPGLAPIKLDAHFPYLGIRRPGDNGAQASDSPHAVLIDHRQPASRLLDRDEAHIVYNTALGFMGDRALALGSGHAWAAAHLAAGGVRLDLVDASLATAPAREGLLASLTSAFRAIRASGVELEADVRAEAAAAAVESLAARRGGGWSLFFLDLTRDDADPEADALLADRFAQPDALVLLYGLDKENNRAALATLVERGWRVMLYRTPRVLGVAWRGKDEPVEHMPDPSAAWTERTHLAGFALSGSIAPPALPAPADSMNSDSGEQPEAGAMSA